MTKSTFYEMIDFAITPFSRAGAWMSISRLDERHGISIPGLYLRTNRELFSYAPLFRVELLRGIESVSFSERMVSGALRLEVASGEFAEFTFDDTGCIRFFSATLGCRLTTGHAESGICLATPAGAGLWRFAWRGHCRCENSFFHLAALSGNTSFRQEWCGRASRNNDWSILPENGRAEFRLEESTQEPVAPVLPASFEACRDSFAREFDSFVDRFPQGTPFDRARFHALYLNWSAQVAPAGLLKRRCMLVSKNKMSGMWAWDHCFNALAMASSQPELAWDQFMAMFDAQNEQGGIPDLLTPTAAMHVYTKPPVHGWIFSLMRKRNKAFFRRREISEQAYNALSGWTRYWMNFRDYARTGLPCYCHGNDSGWDNSTLFLNPVPLASPELIAYLVLQMELLADVANDLGRAHDAQAWRAESTALLERMIDRMWDGEMFCAVTPAGERLSQSGDTLLVHLPLLLGKRLPQAIRAKMRDGMLRPGRFRTEFGLASESVTSEFYESAGYWRGPIWAPSNFIAIAGLLASGEKDTAVSLITDFCALCARHGFYENFDALTGCGNDEITLSWSVSVFLMLSENYDFLMK